MSKSEKTLHRDCHTFETPVINEISVTKMYYWIVNIFRARCNTWKKLSGVNQWHHAVISLTCGLQASPPFKWSTFVSTYWHRDRQVEAGLTVSLAKWMANDKRRVPSSSPLFLLLNWLGRFLSLLIYLLLHLKSGDTEWWICVPILEKSCYVLRVQTAFRWLIRKKCWKLRECFLPGIFVNHVALLHKFLL